MIDSVRNAEEMRLELKKLGFDVPCVDKAGTRPNCKGCYTPDLHQAVGVVTVMTRPNGKDEAWSDPVCAIWLPTYLRIAQGLDGFEGFSIEVIRK